MVVAATFQEKIQEKFRVYSENKKNTSSAAKSAGEIPSNVGFAFFSLTQFFAHFLTFSHMIFPPVGASLAWLGVSVNFLGLSRLIWNKGLFNRETGSAFASLLLGVGRALLLTLAAILPYVLAGTLAGVLAPFLVIGAAALTAVASLALAAWHGWQAVKYLMLKNKPMAKEHFGKTIDYIVYAFGGVLTALALATIMVGLPHISLMLSLVLSVFTAVSLSLVVCAYSAARILFDVLTTDIDIKKSPATDEPSATPGPQHQFKQKELPLNETSPSQIWMKDMVVKKIKDACSYFFSSPAILPKKPTQQPSSSSDKKLQQPSATGKPFSYINNNESSVSALKKNR